MNGLLMLAMICLNVIKTTGDCPRSCECKWKSGKESVLCVNANMTEIPKNLDSGTQVLVLTGNKLQKISADEFFNASLLNLQKIFLSRCKLESIDRSSFRKIINLVELDLSYNDLYSVPSHTFEFIKELRELKLNGNPIGKLLNYAFKMVPRLTKLDLSECRIMYIEIKAFQGLENSLEWLKLDKNKITNINPQAIMNLGNLHGLELFGNSWNCSCKLGTLREWMLKQNVPYSVPPVCKHPSRLTGKIWDKLDLDDFACTPRIKAIMPRKSGEEGSNVTLSCSVDGTPKPNIRWLKKNHIIANLSGVTGGAGKKLYVVEISDETSNLNILTADTQDSGVYVCRAENKAGKSEANITLTITLKPVVKIWSSRMIVAFGVVSSLFATVVGLLTYCAWNLKKRKSYIQHSGNRREIIDGYEMKHKNPIGYNKIRDYENHCSSNANENLQGVVDQSRDSESDRHRNQRINKDINETTDLFTYQKCGKVEDMSWSFLKKSESEDKQSEASCSKFSSDAHISKLNGLETRSTSTVKNDKIQDLSLPNSTRFQKSNSSWTSLNQEKFPDLLELSQNEENIINNNLFSTTQRKRSCKMKRTRHSSFGSDSQSPLLAESSGDSNDSNFSFGEKSFLEKNTSLPTSPANFSQTPIINIIDCSLKQSPTTLKYKSWELEKFLKEYRNLQDQLFKMKESCENLKEDNLKFRKSENTSNSVETATISKIITPIYLEEYKSDFIETKNFESFYNESDYFEKDNYNPKTVQISNNEDYWAPEQQILKNQNPFYKS